MKNLHGNFYLGKNIDLSDLDLKILIKAAKLAVMNVMLTSSEKWRNIFPNEKT